MTNQQKVALFTGAGSCIGADLVRKLTENIDNTRSAARQGYRDK